MNKILCGAAVLFVLTCQASAQQGEKSLSGPIDHRESRNDAQQPGRTPETRPVDPERMTEIARMLRQVNAMVQKVSDLLEHAESLDRKKTAEVSGLTGELSDVMGQMSDQIAGGADSAGLETIRARVNGLYARMAGL